MGLAVREAVMARKQHRRTLARLRRRERSAWFFILPAGLLVGLLVLPLGALLWNGIMGQFATRITDPIALSALRLSLLTSSVSVLIALLTGTPLAYMLARWSFPGRAWLELAIDLPVVLPPSVAGIALLLTFGRRGLLGSPLAALGLSLPFTPAAVVIAQTFVATPFYIRAARIGFSAVDRHVEESAFAEGASQWQLFRHVMLPLSGRALLSGLILCWTRALSEFGATILFAGNLEGQTETMPLAIYLGFEQDLSVAVALSVLLLLVSAVLLFALRRLEKESSA